MFGPSVNELLGEQCTPTPEMALRHSDAMGVGSRSDICATRSVLAIA